MPTGSQAPSWTPTPLKELVPDFLDKGAPLEGEVKKESVYFLTKTGKIKSPITPPPMNNHGNYVVSMSKLNVWMAGLAETAGVNIFPEFAGVEVLYDGNKVIGVRTGDKGIDASGNKKSNYEPGTDLHARVTVFGEGSRGSLTKDVIAHFGLDKGKNPPAFEVGVKEVWELPETRLQPGEVVHCMGYPLKSDTFGGGFIYGMKDNMVAVGQLTSLDYSDPCLDPHREFQRFKLHPMVSDLLKGGKLVQYGAKTAPVGGYFAIPKLAFAGGMIIGDGANLFNGQKIKGIDLAMRSGMLAAQTIFEGLLDDDLSDARLAGYAKAMEASDEIKGLRKVRNFHQAMTRGLYLGLMTAGAQFALGGRVISDRLSSQSRPHSHEDAHGEIPHRESVGRSDGRHQVRQATHLRQRDRRLLLGRHARGGTAVSSEDQGPQHLLRRVLQEVRQSLRAFLPGQRLRDDGG